ncbi:hypothetical protein [Calycomorphotria hydatis]|uniref:hypothetical protein n=1 Tax=Calycomorphotria hydatis TaxID=2528027 RepID=UPI0011AAB299|nr:hypothetical protein [Calycomorphotria hydatis]
MIEALAVTRDVADHDSTELNILSHSRVISSADGFHEFDSRSKRPTASAGMAAEAGEARQ